MKRSDVSVSQLMFGRRKIKTIWIPESFDENCKPFINFTEAVRVSTSLMGAILSPKRCRLGNTFISLVIPRPAVIMLDDLVGKGFFMNRSEAIRAAIYLLLMLYKSSLFCDEVARRHVVQ